MTLDLTWTGSQFLDARRHTDAVLGGLGAIDLTNKGEVWSESVAAGIAGYFALAPGSVRVAAGATQVLEALLRGLSPGLVVDVVPNFHLTATLSRQEGWAYRAVPVREPAELLPAVAPYLRRDDVVLSLSSPRNPLGYQFALDDVAALLERAACAVVLDEVYADFASDSALRLVARYPNLFVLRTFSKAWGLANLRIGFGASGAFADGAVRPVRLRLIPNSVSGVAQRAAGRLLADPRAVRDSIARAQGCRDAMAAALDGLPGLRVWPSEANYLCLESAAAPAAAAALARVGYAVRLLHDLRDYPPHWPPGMRVSVPAPPHADAVVACLREVHAACGPIREVG